MNQYHSTANQSPSDYLPKNITRHILTIITFGYDQICLYLYLDRLLLFESFYT